MLSGREVIKECTNHCMICKKNKAARVSQLKAPLPQIRFKFNIRTFRNVRFCPGAQQEIFQGRGDFMQFGHFNKHFVINKRKEGPAGKKFGIFFS